MTKQKIYINNTLVHGICNYNCYTCGVNKQSYHGPKEYQPEMITNTLMRRIKEAALEGITVRYLTNSGNGEPTLHPDFIQRMKKFGEMIDNWDLSMCQPPEVAVVTNGTLLTKNGILEAMTDNNICLIISFPTSHPEHYGEITVMQAQEGQKLLDKVVPGIERAMKLKTQGHLPKLSFHIAPPHGQYIRQDFKQTIEFLCALAKKNGLNHLNLIMFPAKPNRAGLVRNLTNKLDFYRDLFFKYNKRMINGVKVYMMLMPKKFFPSLKDIIGLIWHYDFPCFYEGNNFFISSGGDACCCNDQAVQSSRGNIQNMSFRELLKLRKTQQPAKICKSCNQVPHRMRGSLFILFISLLVRVKLFVVKRLRNWETYY